MERTKFTTQPLPQLYNVEDEPIVLSKCLLDTLLKQPNHSDLIALYTFYYYTAKWQKTNQPKATTKYTAQGMGWSVERTIRNKKRLIEIGLVEDVVLKNVEGKVTGHFVKINFIWQNVENHPMGKPPSGFPIDKFLRTNIEKEKNKKIQNKNKIPPPLNLVQRYCQERNNGIDAQHFIDFYESKGWLIGKNHMKDWQAAVRTWEQNDKLGKNKGKPPYKEFDGMRFYLNGDGEYYNKKGTPWID